MTSSPETVDSSGPFEATSEEMVRSSATTRRDPEDFTNLAHIYSISKAFDIFTPKKSLCASELL